MTVRFGDLALDWLGYATLRIEAPDVTVYLDPGRYGVLTGEWEPDSEAARGGHPPGADVHPRDGDIVCVSHVHHYDPDGIERVAASDATVVVFDGLRTSDTDRTDVRPADLPVEVRRVGMEDERLVGDVPIWTVPAYNEPDGPHTNADGSPVHPRGFGCGFLLAVDGTRLFWPGDTDVLEGHEALDVDVFCPPIGGSFTMDRHGAAALARGLVPDLTLPIHYNTFAALETDSRAFAADVAASGVPVVLDESG